MKRTILLMVIIFALTACSDKEKEAELQKRITELETQLDECKNGADKLLAKIKLSFEEEDFDKVKNIYSELKKRHPETEAFKEATKIYENSLEIEEKKRKETERIAEEERQKKLQALNKLKKKPDDVSGITWYYNPYFTHYNNRNLTSIYMGNKESRQPWLILKMSYQGDDWIFFERAFLSYDGNTKEIIFDEYDNKKTENSGGSVWEWIQVSVDSDTESFFT
ncbi:MAG: hypothetical protein ACP5DZ_03770 [Bacteroidales bacterium]